MKKIAIVQILLIVLVTSVSANTDTIREAQQHFEKANELLKHLDYEAAIAEYSKIIILSSGSKIAQDAQYWIGQSHFRAGQFDAAKATFTELIEQYPKSAIVPVTKLMVERVEQEKKDEANRRAISAASDKGVIVDPETAVKYTKIETFSGKSDVIEYTTDLNLSPNGRFLLNWDIVIPLGGGKPFKLVDMPAGRGTWSPDGKKAVFYSSDGICAVPVSPNTGHSTGSPRKLLDGKYLYAFNVSWSPDGHKFVFERKDKDATGDIYTLSVKDGTLTEITNDPIREFLPKWSPDGKSIAYKRGYETWVVPAQGGSPKKISTHKDRLLSWTPDSKWLVCRPSYWKLRFVHVTDGREFELMPPKEVGRHFAWSSEGNSILFYRSSYDWRSALKLVSASGGPSFELGRQFELWPYIQFWSPDSKIILTEGKGGIWISPLAGGDPFILELDVSVPGKPIPFSLSPDRRKLLFFVEERDGVKDLWGVPVSLKDGRTSGPAVMVLSGWNTKLKCTKALSWSPDGKKIAVIHKSNVWIAPTEGGKAMQFTKTPERKLDPFWLPGGEMIAYTAAHSQKERTLMVVSLSGGEPRKLLDTTDQYAWSANGKEIAFVSKQLILAIPVAGGEARRIADLKELDLDGELGLCWSPDGYALAFVGHKAGKYMIFTVPLKGGKFTELAVDDPGEKYRLWWSPDGKWISYQSDGFIKTRSEATMWEADFEEILEKALQAD